MQSVVMLNAVYDVLNDVYDLMHGTLANGEGTGQLTSSL
jgi:hypothetical protein